MQRKKKSWFCVAVCLDSMFRQHDLSTGERKIYCGAGKPGAALSAYFSHHTLSLNTLCEHQSTSCSHVTPKRKSEAKRTTFYTDLSQKRVCIFKLPQFQRLFPYITGCHPVKSHPSQKALSPRRSCFMPKTGDSICIKYSSKVSLIHLSSMHWFVTFLQSDKVTRYLLWKKLIVQDRNM